VAFKQDQAESMCNGKHKFAQVLKDIFSFSLAVLHPFTFKRSEVPSNASVSETNTEESAAGTVTGSNEASNNPIYI
jgi:hypothetical protein